MRLQMIRIRDRRVFAVDGRDYTVEDVVLAAVLRGDWSTFVEGVARGIACAQNAGDRRTELEDAIELASEDFRQERDLLSAEEMEAWLESWGLSADEWYACIERKVLLEDAGEDELDISGVTPDEIAEVVAPELITSGKLDRWTATLAGRAAVTAAPAAGDSGASFEDPDVDLDAAGLGWVDPSRAGERLRHLAFLEEGFARFRHSVIHDAALEEHITSHGLDYTLFEYVVLRCSSLAVAREAILCVREDRMRFEQVAEAAEIEFEEQDALFMDLEESLRVSFLSVQAGDVLEPVEGEDGIVVVGLRSKTLPSIEDERLRGIASERMLRSIVRNRINDRVSWNTEDRD